MHMRNGDLCVVNSSMECWLLLHNRSILRHDCCGMNVNISRANVSCVLLITLSVLILHTWEMLFL